MATSPVKKHLTNLDEWQRMAEAGIFPPNYRIELVEGEILVMPPISSNHSSHVMRINKVLGELTADFAIFSVHNPLQLGNFSEPAPDFMLLKPVDDFYSSRHLNADDVLLLVEVADSSLAYDRNQKLRLYALHNVAEYWLLNLNDNCLEVYREPFGETYAQKSTLRTGDSVTLTQLPDITIQVSSIL